MKAAMAVQVNFKLGHYPGGRRASRHRGRRRCGRCGANGPQPGRRRVVVAFVGRRSFLGSSHDRSSSSENVIAPPSGSVRAIGFSGRLVQQGDQPMVARCHAGALSTRFG